MKTRQRAQILGLCASLVLGLGSSAFAVTFTYTFTDPSGSGFNDPVDGAQRKAALEDVGDIWGGLLQDSYAGETINVTASFQALGGDKTSATLASAGPTSFYTLNGGSSVPDTWYAGTLTNHLIESAYAPAPQIDVTVNSDIGSTNVLPGHSLYYGTDGHPGTNQFDFVSIALHEFGHGLGFLSGYNSDGSDGITTNGGTGYPTIFDQFLTLGNPDQPGSQSIVGMTDAQRQAAFISGNIYWDGANGKLGNGGNAPKLFAPNPFEDGSSISHTDESTYPNDLMSPEYSGVDHMPSGMDLGMLKDIGWTVNVPTPEPTSLAFLALAGVAVMRRRR